MNAMQTFDSPEFGHLRILEQDGTLWFIGKDVADVLEYKNPRKAITDHVDEEDRKKQNIPTSQNVTLVAATWLINESGLYSLIFSSFYTLTK